MCSVVCSSSKIPYDEFVFCDNTREGMELAMEEVFKGFINFFNNETEIAIARSEFCLKTSINHNVGLSYVNFLWALLTMEKVG